MQTIRRLSLSLVLVCWLAGHALAQESSEPMTFVAAQAAPSSTSEGAENARTMLSLGFNPLPQQAHWYWGQNSIDIALGTASGRLYDRLCIDQWNTINLSDWASRNPTPPLCLSNRQRWSATAAFNRGSTRVGVSAAAARQVTAQWDPGSFPIMLLPRFDQNNFIVFGRQEIGKEGFVALAGSYARARLVSRAEDTTTTLSGKWDSRSLSVVGGYGAFSANIVSRVVDTPGSATRWQGLGLGLTWRTPWSGHLSVGAENIVSRGINPFAHGSEDTNGSTIPYVRYEQDL